VRPVLARAEASYSAGADESSGAWEAEQETAQIGAEIGAFLAGLPVTSGKPEQQPNRRAAGYEQASDVLPDEIGAWPVDVVVSVGGAALPILNAAWGWQPDPMLDPSGPAQPAPPAGLVEATRSVMAGRMVRLWGVVAKDGRVEFHTSEGLRLLRNTLKGERDRS
jgi:hypothetical protein